MKLLIKVYASFRRIPNAIWRRLLSKPTAWFLEGLCGVRFGYNPTFVGWPVFKGEGDIHIGNDCALVSSRLANPIGLYRPCIFEAISLHSRIRIGNQFSASGVCIVAETEIIIGNNVSIGANSTIIDTDFHAIRADARARLDAPKTKSIRIEDDVWIGMNAVILKGLTIQRGAVVGANAVVTKDIPAGAVVVGNPARIILG